MLTLEQIAKKIWVKTSLNRKGVTGVAYYYGQEVGAAINCKYNERAIKDAREVGAKAVLAALMLQLKEDVEALLNNPVLADKAATGLAWIAANADDAEKLEKFKARCQQLINEASTSNLAVAA